jgi:hypothetical protein
VPLVKASLSGALYLNNRTGKEKRKKSEKTRDLKRKRVEISASRKKLQRAYGGCLGARCRRRTWDTAKSLGEPCTGDDPGVSEWGNPL